jgi:glycosyltransferase involved in cell wall biosynthesis
VLALKAGGADTDGRAPTTSEGETVALEAPIPGNDDQSDAHDLRAVPPARNEPAPLTVTFLIPAYNEAGTIDEVLDRIAELPVRKQIICVDDGSYDGTLEILTRRAEETPNMIVVSQRNRGKGAAIRTGIPYVTGDIAVIQDADMEYDPAEVPRLIEPIRRGVADVVYGSRLSGGQPQRAYMFWHLVGNKFLTLTTNVLFNTTLSDMETGYKAFRADVLASLDLHQDSFAIEPEITAKICKRKLRIYEMPISYYGRTYEEGKKITWRDGFKALWVLAGARIGAL